VICMYRPTLLSIEHAQVAADHLLGGGFRPDQSIAKNESLNTCHSLCNGRE
jgi:hypothetical protein